jgi:DNA-binding transcriptional regulator YiaG
MAAKRKFKSDAFEAIHSSASAMYKVGAIDTEYEKGRYGTDTKAKADSCLFIRVISV